LENSPDVLDAMRNFILKLIEADDEENRDYCQTIINLMNLKVRRP
jgi:hypothetical protein